MGSPRFARSRNFKFAAGDGSGDISTTSTTFADISIFPALSLEAQTGDVLEMTLSCVFYSGTSGTTIDTCFNINGVDLATGVGSSRYAAPGVNTVEPSVTKGLRLLVAGDISSGLVAVKPRWKVSAANGLMGNGSAAIPTFIVKNLGPSQPN